MFKCGYIQLSGVKVKPENKMLEFTSIINIGVYVCVYIYIYIYIHTYIFKIYIAKGPSEITY